MFRTALRTLTLGGFIAAVVMHVAPAAACPTVTSISPNSGPLGTSVTITGTNFSTATTVKFGSTAVAFTINSATSITAASPPGSGTVDVTVTDSGGTSTTSTADQFTYAAVPADSPADSLKLRALQIAATKITAQGSGQAITGAVEGAISDDLNGNRSVVSPTGSGLRLYFTKAPPSEWRAWADVRGTGFEGGAAGSDFRDSQINATAGLTRRLTPDLLVGMLAGYENFDYSAQSLGGRLTGDGWGVGGYFGWRFAAHMRWDATVVRSGLNYDGVAGTAAATFPGSRWLVSSGVTGTYDWRAVVFEPSARIYSVWEREDAYTDSLGTAQAERNFSSGRVSAGTKVTYPIAWSPTTVVAPYVGIYGDYYFSRDDADTFGLPSIPLISGWSARVAAGIGVNFERGLQLAIGGELGGIGGDYTFWTWRARASLPF
ncbi:MAG: autotransporter domain-containing protein [Xanthobacteraceae bacterium]